MMSLPSVFDWSSCPLRKPSPAAAISTMETMPQAIPNMVRNVRSLWDQRVRKTSRIRSRRTMVIFAAQDWTLSQAEGKPGGAALQEVIRQKKAICSSGRTAISLGGENQGCHSEERM